MFLTAFEISLSATGAYDWQYYRSFLYATPVVLKDKSEILYEKTRLVAEEIHYASIMQGYFWNKCLFIHMPGMAIYTCDTEPVVLNLFWAHKSIPWNRFSRLRQNTIYHYLQSIHLLVAEYGWRRKGPVRYATVQLFWMRWTYYTWRWCRRWW